MGKNIYNTAKNHYYVAHLMLVFSPHSLQAALNLPADILLLAMTRASGSKYLPTKWRDAAT